jgi:hypothetical protein
LIGHPQSRQEAPLLNQVKEWLGTGSKLFERRGALRVETPPECVVFIEGRTHALRNWSASGFLASPYDGGLKENRGFMVRVAIRHDHHDFVFDARAVAVRRDAGGLAARFVAVSEQNQRLIDDYFNHFALWVSVTR